MNTTKYSRLTLTIVAALAAVSFTIGAGCSKPTTAESVVNDATSKMTDMVGSAWNSLKGATFDQRATVTDTIGKATTGLQNSANDWSSKLSSLSGDARASASSALDDLNNAIGDIRARLSGVNGATASSWDDIKSGLMSAFRKAQDAYTRVKAAFAKQM